MNAENADQKKKNRMEIGFDFGAFILLMLSLTSLIRVYLRLSAANCFLTLMR